MPKVKEDTPAPSPAKKRKQEAQPTHEIAIAGAGAVGLFACARLLADGRRSIALIAPDGAPPETTTTAPLPAGKVSLLNIASLNALAHIGIDTADLAGAPVSEMRVWDANSTGNTVFSAAQEGLPHLGVVVDDARLRRLLWQAVDAHPQRHSAVELVPAAVTATHLDADARVLICGEDKVRAQLALACDGAHSVLSRQAGLQPIQTAPCAQSAVICHIQSEVPHEGVALQPFTGDGAVGILPLPSAPAGRWRHLIWSCPDRRAHALADASAADFRAALFQVTEGALGAVHDISQRRCVHIVPQRRRLFAERLALAGDAALSLHPLAGQGLNLGLADVGALAANLRAPSSDSFWQRPMLQKYSRQRHWHHLSMAAFTMGLLPLFAMEHPAMRWMRARGMGTVHHVPRLKSALVKVAEGIF